MLSAVQRCDSQSQLKAEAYGPNLSDVEKQIAAHNILHQEVEAYSNQLQPSTVASKVRAQSNTSMQMPSRSDH